MNALYTDFRWGFDGEPQSMLVEDGRVVARGSEAIQARPGIAVQDLGGAYLLPSFIDPHCHILPTGLDLQKLYLGHLSSRADILEAVRQAHRELSPDKWLLAVHYDQNKFPDNRHLTLAELDAVVPERPVLLRHVNGHASVANTAALKAARIAEDTPDPSGGTFSRNESGRLNGLLLEHAHEQVTAFVPDPTLDEMVDAILLASEKMSELGIACASDMMTGRFNLARELEAYRIASEKGARVRFRLYVQWGTVFGPRPMPKEEFEEFQHAMAPARCRVAGIKIFADGAIGSATAAIYGKFSGQPIDRRMILSKRSTKAMAVAEREVDGQLMYEPERLFSMVRTAHDAGYPVSIHSIGDYSTDLVMDAFEKVGDPSRHRIEHAMILSDSQIEQMGRLGCRCVMQPEFLMRFAHSYRKQLGPERASMLNRYRSVADAGIRLSFSSDRPIVAGDPKDGMRTAVKRPEGYVQSESVTPEFALKAYTEYAAEANDDLALMGSLTPGQVADFQVSESSPLDL